MKHNRSARKTKQENAVTAASDVPVYVSPLEEESLRLLEITEKTAQDMQPYYKSMVTADTPQEEADVQSRIASYKRANLNIAKASQQSFALSDELNARWNDIRKSRRKNAAPANAEIDLAESTSLHFARGLNIYKLLLICFVGSFAGVVIELVWCLLRNGYLESRSGLVYGPFNLLYGIGAVALTAALYRFRNRGSWLSFLGGMIVGSVVEYICSWAQEVAFGSRSWDYSNMPFNLNGRICLLYSFFWGILGVVWIKGIYPRMVEWILKIPNRAGKIITWALLVFFIWNALVTGISVLRWTQRLNGREAEGSFWELVDRRFPDERMERIFANMEFELETSPDNDGQKGE